MGTFSRQNNQDQYRVSDQTLKTGLLGSLEEEALQEQMPRAQVNQSMHFVIEDENYFGQQSIIPNQEDEDGGEEGISSQQINLSEYLEQAYDRFDPQYRVAFEEDEDSMK